MSLNSLNLGHITHQPDQLNLLLFPGLEHQLVNAISLRLWNSLPVARKTTSASSIRSKLKTHFFKIPFLP